MKILQGISRLVLGLLFLFSGFVKALDPLGSSYKFSDYFNAFGMGFLENISLPLGIFLAAFELVLGLVLILGYQKKKTYLVLFLFMSFFTILTFILALTNPVTDCGCFGDALVLTNWQTFFKNLIFMGFVLILFRSRRRAENVLSGRLESSMIILFFLGCFLLSLTALRHLPVLDFRPYKVGTHIPSAMIIPEGEAVDEYSTILIYRNLENGENEEFTIENYPQDTLKYEFVTSESQLVSKGYEPPIHDFGIIDPEGFDVSDELLSFKGYSLLMASYDLARADQEMLAAGNDWFELQRFASDFKFIPVTASSSGIIEDISDDLGLDYEFYAGDEIMIKTMIRSNPGLILLKNGTIIAKWSTRDFPSMAEWNGKWPELIQQYMQEQDPEIMMLIEEGFMEDLNWDMIDFDLTANQLVMSTIEGRSHREMWLFYSLIIGLILLLSQFLPKLKKQGRV